MLVVLNLRSCGPNGRCQRYRHAYCTQYKVTVASLKRKCSICSASSRNIHDFSHPSNILPRRTLSLPGPSPCACRCIAAYKMPRLSSGRQSRSLATKMFALLLTVASSLASLGGVAAHGYVQDVVVGSIHYTGYLPYTDPYYNPPPERIIRKIPGNGTAFDQRLSSATDLCCRSRSGCNAHRVSGSLLQKATHTPHSS